MLSPIMTLFKHFPLRAYSTVALMLLICWYAYRKIRRSVETGTITKTCGILRMLLISYTVLLLFFTVFGRRSQDYYHCILDVGYSYRDVWTTGDPGVALQIGANIAVFIPIGAAVFLLSKRFPFLSALAFGIGLSVCIELLQLVLRNGTCEIDDLISNFLGTFLGCMATGACRFLRQRLRE